VRHFLSFPFHVSFHCLLLSCFLVFPFRVMFPFLSASFVHLTKPP
jgi:hypothetical protein